VQELLAMMKSWTRSLLPPLLMLVLLLPGMARAQISVDVSANVAPPELPVYDQPPIPGDGYLWTPGYWAWSDDDQDYYWVPGTWVMAPQPDYLWTPGYWGTQGAVFFWHPGYWGPQIGFYGGVNYGYGYGGLGYEGGYWQGGRLYYNRSVNNIGTVNITNVYNRTVVNNVTVNRVSYNGGNGIQVRPTAEELAAARAPHLSATPAQVQQVNLARSQPALRASQNQGHPPVAATSRPGVFSGTGVVAAKSSASSNAGRQAAPPRDNPAARPAPGTSTQRDEVEPRPAQSFAPSRAAPPPSAEPRTAPPPPSAPAPAPRAAPSAPPPAEPRAAPPPPRPATPPVHPNPRPAEHEPEH
jgi:hypothetical protein